MTDKTLLRRRLLEQRNAIPPAEKASAEAIILDRLFSLDAWKQAPLICGYVSEGSEFSTEALWARASVEGKEYALPVTVTGAREGRMIFRRLPGFTPEALIPGRFGIPEPSEDCPALSLRDYSHALVIVPGLSFDPKGYRIGYGGGYYDRFLSALAEAHVPYTSVGPVFGACLSNELPHEAHDIPVDYVLDERRIIQVHGH